jgi:pullulanase/glycogen debranching enzyme
MTCHDGLWILDVRPLALAAGRYEYKFIVNGEWEPGANRALAVGEQHWLERPPDIILDARIEEASRITVYLKQAVASLSNVTVTVDPPVPVREVKLIPSMDQRALAGFMVSGGYVVFCFDDKIHKAGLSSNDAVFVAGTFNGWNSQSWRLDWVGNGVWQKTFSASDAQIGVREGRFKFVVNDSRWIGPRIEAPNIMVDDGGNLNFRLAPEYSRGSVIEISMAAPVALSNALTLVISNLAPRVIRHPLRPGAILEGMRIQAPLGVSLDPQGGRARVSVFAPRASRMELLVSEHPQMLLGSGAKASGGTPMRLDPLEGVWTGVWSGLSKAAYYGFRVDGPQGIGESFDFSAFVGDPYARAVVSENGPCVLIDPGATNAWFGGWSDGAYTPPAPKDMVIYETHVRDLTIDPSSGVPESLRGTFEGVLATSNTGTGLDHLKALGVNMIEFMPIQEFDNGTNAPGWGYSPDYYFAPESSYGRNPVKGSQYYEFKRMVNELHRRGFGVIIDVVYNHVGGANSFSKLDRRSYFRLDAEDGYSNFSGCGNDLRTESPVMRRLIVDNVLYWIKEHHVDGFRFDLAELIDMETLMAVQQAAKAANPDVVLIAEPWSSRGDQKQALRGTAWAAWNNQFTHPVRSFIKGEGRSDEVMKAIAGSVELWTTSPMQSINYFESHDDMALADELSTAPGRDGRILTPADTARHRLAATVLFTSLGIPMLNEGQEFLRSKRGIRNTFDRGDLINAVRWSERDRPQARELLTYYRDMIRLRQSPEGASLRVAEAPPACYYEWITPGSGQLLGYRINARHERPGRAFVVLVNASERDESFVVDFPVGRWQLVGDGHRVDLAGKIMNPMSVAGGARSRIKVPALTSYVLMDGP